MKNIFKKTFSGLTKTRVRLSHIFSVFAGKSILSCNEIEELEEALLNADIGWELTEIIIEELKKPDKFEVSLEDRFIKCIQNYLIGIKNVHNFKKVIILVGVNGTGKTTSVAKIGNYFSNSGKLVSLVAADTYRAAAVEQIKIWSKRINLHLTANELSNDPASVAFDGVKHGINNNIDHIIVDTSGRLHTSINLMKELEKIYKVITKITSEIDVIICIDSNTGQNAIQQAREFIKFIPVTGIVLTKMDGTAKGGIAVQIMKELKLPIFFIGIGEKVDDLIPFDQKSYINSLIKNK